MVLAVGILSVRAGVAWSYAVTAHCGKTANEAQPPACNSGWHPGQVWVTWTWEPNDANPTAGCLPQSYWYDITTEITCRVEGPEGHGSAAQEINVEISDPSDTAVLSRPPDFNGWYNKPVGVSFQGSSFSGIAFCTQSTIYAGPDRMNASVSGTCTDNAGKEAEGASVSFPYDATPPTITGVIPSRAPDYNGWYNHPVSFTFVGADATSGIESCSTPTYAGPDNENAAVIGSCRDRAGNVASFTLPIRYQATPPSLTAAAETGDSSVSLRWQASVDVTIARSPGLKGAPSSVVYQGNSGSLDDTQVRNGVRYQYTLTAQDQAGNTTVRNVLVMPGPRLLAPVANAHVAGPPLLQWTAVPRTRYYNLQLYYRGAKVLSAWPTQPSLRLKPAWTFAGRHHRLKPGLYRWYVWPGLGRRAAARYGPLIGTGTFVVESPKPR
jgi:hypothetical protein